MRRRTLLAAVGTGTAGLAGCLGDGVPGIVPADEPTYETCEKLIVREFELTGTLRREAEAAIEGEYEADHVHITGAIDVDRTYLQIDGEYYRPIVEEGDGTTTLTLEPALPRKESPISIWLEYEGSEPTDVAIGVCHRERDQLLVDETVALDPGARWTTEASPYLGTYEVEVETDAVEERLELDQWDTTGFEGIVIDDEGATPLTWEADLMPCPWNE